MNQRPSVLQQTWRRAPATSIIIGVNLVVFLLWYLSPRFPALEKFMIYNFLVSTEHLKEGHWWTLVSSVFSHMEMWHLAINMFVLWSFGIVLEQFWGTRTFLRFYFAAGVVGSACHCLASAYLMNEPGIPALGASGAVSGLLLAYALHFPRAKILLFGIIPMPALVGVLAFVGLDLWGLIEQSKGGGLSIGHGAHLGGALAGALMWFFHLRRHYVPRKVPSLTRAEAAEFERIIEKAKREGPDSLSFDERQFVADMQHKLTPR
jgi:membrane associated rhomboid family serine protease